MAIPANDEPAEAPGSHNRAEARAYHGGDLRGIREHLDYFKDLGVTTLWLTPIVKNGATEDYHGYGAVDLYAVEPHLGTLRNYQELVAAAHQQGMKIVFDVVPNHVGPQTSVGREAAIAGLVSRNCEESPEFVDAGERKLFTESRQIRDMTCSKRSLIRTRRLDFGAT